jgi:hypothetical protein
VREKLKGYKVREGGQIFELLRPQTYTRKLPEPAFVAVLESFDILRRALKTTQLNAPPAAPQGRVKMHPSRSLEPRDAHESGIPRPAYEGKRSEEGSE